MKEHKFILEPYNGMKTRHHCPSCKQRDKTFSLYIDSETGEHIHPTVGRCNREINCGNHYTPKQYFQDNNISFDTPLPTAYKSQIAVNQPKTISFIPVEIFNASLKAHEKNHFVKFLIDIFGNEVASQMVSLYFIGTSEHWEGATVFWQIDTTGKIRTGKVMLYSPATGKRIKHPYNYINWAHSLIKDPEFQLRQCLFGEHLLIDKTKPVAIVESEKTAIIASIYLPEFIWLATGGISNLNIEVCSVLKGRNVILFPDLNGFDKWSSRAKEFSHLATFIVSDLLERKATKTERQQGFDIADYLIKLDYKSFSLPSGEVINHVSKDKLISSVKSIEPIIRPNSEGWEKIISELENYFSSISIPLHSMKLNAYSTIVDCSLFVESHLTIVKANKGNHAYLPYLNRLQELKQVLTTNSLNNEN
jgi:hypothetical protein